MNASQAHPKVAIEYLPITLPTPSGEGINEFLRTTTLLCQGRAVMLKEEDVTTLQFAYAFKTIFLHAEEAVFCTKSGEQILLFSHGDVPPLRPSEIDESLWNTICTLRDALPLASSIANPPPVASLNLSSFSTANANASSASLLEFVRILSTKITPSFDMIFLGPVHPLELFAACLVVFGRVQTLSYTEGDHIVRIA